MLSTRHSLNLIIVLFIIYIFHYSSATTCLVCSSFISNEDCNVKGVVRQCKVFEVCENKVTHYSSRVLITKRCTPQRTCSDTCRGQKISSVCKTCCSSDKCNQALLAPLPTTSFRNEGNQQGQQNGNNRRTTQCATLFISGVAMRCVRLKTGNPAGTTCLFWCRRSDYELHGPSRLTCVQTEQGATWSGSPPICTQKNVSPQLRNPGACGPLEYDTKILEMSCTNKFNFRSSCSFQCKEGYYMVEPNTYEHIAANVRSSVCWRGVQSPVVWTRPPPNCMTKKCPILVREEHSTAICTSWIRIGSVCDFSCLPGFYRVGPQFVSCLDVDPLGPDAIWNDTVPYCQPRNCSQLSLPSDVISMTCSEGNVFKSECEFTCSQGYYMSAADDLEPLSENMAESKCRVSSEDKMIWQPAPPNCNIKSCPNIPSLDNGDVVCTRGNRYMSTCTFSCADAFLLAGIESVTCIEGPGGNSEFGVWDAPIPWCRPKVCEELVYDKENIDVSCTDGIRYGTVCTYTCKVGYFMTTSDAQNFIPSGKSETECVISPQRTIVWSETAPVCHLKSCKELSNPENGLVLCTDENNHGSECSFSCSIGYVLRGRRRLTCIDSGTHIPRQTWDFEEPTCQPKPCPELEYNQKTTNLNCTDGVSFRSICTFKCKKGHYMPSPISDEVMGNTATICVLNQAQELEWSSGAPDCFLKTCKALKAPTNGNVGCTDDTNHDSVCTFTCDPGYEPDGEADSRCTDDGYNSKQGVWSQPPPSCIRRTCDMFDVDLATTGFMCDNEMKFESKCEFHCMEGHYMARGNEVVDVATTECGVSRNQMVWSESPPECKLKACPEIEKPERGLLRCNNANNFGSGCLFMCSPGFYLEGQRMLQCEDNGINNPLGAWNHDIPTCERKACPAPDPENLHRLSEYCSIEYLFESKCNYSCIDGYYMTQGEDITNINKLQVNCGVRGRDMTWSSELPQCRMKTCVAIGVPENAVESCTDNYNYESTCSYSCLSGYNIKGKVKKTCQNSPENHAMGVWSNDLPSCEPRSCNKITYDTKSLTMKCTNGQKFKSICQFSCQNGYYAVEDESENFLAQANTTCLVNDQDKMIWSDSPPQCRKKTCEVHTGFANGKISCTDKLLFESVCSFECIPGYQLVGESDTTCIDTDPFSKFGNWSNDMPVCKPRPCPALAYDKKTVTVECSSSNLFESVCEFGCVHGFYMTSADDEEVIDTASTTCAVRRGRMYWTKASPNCLIKRCPRARKPKDGTVVCDKGNSFQSSCFFSCSAIRELKGNDTLTCGADSRNIPEGQWNAPFPECELRSCPNWEIDERAIVETCTNVYKYGSKCIFSCNEGFYIPVEKRTNEDGVTNAECGIKKTVMTWSGRPPACEIKTCPALEAPRNGTFECSDGYNWDTECTFTCARGYLLIGQKSLTCEDDGKDGPIGVWNGEEPICEPRSCTELKYDQETQEVECSYGVKYGSVCAITCIEGYYLTSKNGIDLVDNASAVCDVNPKNRREVAWDHDEPKCLIKTCPDLEPPPDGLAECETGTTFGSKCVYKCLPGFKVVGLSITTCKDDGRNVPTGVWSKDTPTCEPKSCARLVNNPNTTNYECTDGRKYRSVCTFSCNKGYLITGGDGRTIIESGEKSTTCGRGSGDGMAWTHELPNCLSKFCLAIRPRKNMTMDCTDKFRFNSVCKFACDPPLKLIGPPVITCIDDETSAYSGKWDKKHWGLKCKR